jgi:hypothetical protein
VFITAVPITKLFAWGEGDSGTSRDDEPRAWYFKEVFPKWDEVRKSLDTALHAQTF